jgi:hypothetical protein
MQIKCLTYVKRVEINRLQNLSGHPNYRVRASGNEERPV